MPKVKPIFFGQLKFDTSGVWARFSVAASAQIGRSNNQDQLRKISFFPAQKKTWNNVENPFRGVKKLVETLFPLNF